MVIMKKIVILLVALLGLCCCKTSDDYKRVYLDDVALDGGIVVDKYVHISKQSYYDFEIPCFKLTHIIGSDSDTLLWYRVPLEIYISYEVGDTIWPLREK